MAKLVHTLTKEQIREKQRKATGLHNSERLRYAENVRALTLRAEAAEAALKVAEAEIDRLTAEVARLNAPKPTPLTPPESPATM